MTTMRTFMLRKKLCKLNCVARFCVRAEIQKPCGCNHKQSTAELYWILNIPFSHFTCEAIFFVIVNVVRYDTGYFVKVWNKRERFFRELWRKPALNHKKKKTEKCISFGSFLIKKCFCFVKENNAILTRDKLSRCIHNLCYDLWWFLFHLHRQLVSWRGKAACI